MIFIKITKEEFIARNVYVIDGFVKKKRFSYIQTQFFNN